MQMALASWQERLTANRVERAPAPTTRTWTGARRESFWAPDLTGDGAAGPTSSDAPGRVRPAPHELGLKYPLSSASRSTGARRGVRRRAPGHDRLRAARAAREHRHDAGEHRVRRPEGLEPQRGLRGHHAGPRRSTSPRRSTPRCRSASPRGARRVDPRHRHHGDRPGGGDRRRPPDRWRLARGRRHRGRGRTGVWHSPRAWARSWPSQRRRGHLARPGARRHLAQRAGPQGRRARHRRARALRVRRRAGREAARRADPRSRARRATWWRSRQRRGRCRSSASGARRRCGVRAARPRSRRASSAPSAPSAPDSDPRTSPRWSPTCAKYDQQIVAQCSRSSSRRAGAGAHPRGVRGGLQGQPEVDEADDQARVAPRQRADGPHASASCSSSRGRSRSSPRPRCTRSSITSSASSGR